jgi:hypothetical protein
MADRQSITRAFLCLAVLAGGPLLGAKLFDLIVLAGAWSAHPPASLAMMGNCVLNYAGERWYRIRDRTTLKAKMIISTTRPMGLIGSLLIHGALAASTLGGPN